MNKTGYYLYLQQTGNYQQIVNEIQVNDFDELKIVVDAYIHLEEPLMALSWLEKWKDEITSQDELAWLKKLYGRVYILLNKPSEALTFFKEAESLLKEVMDVELETRLKIRIAHVYEMEERHEEALELLEEAISVLSRLGNKNDLAIAYYEIGMVYFGLDMKEEALMSLEKAKYLFMHHRNNFDAHLCDAYITRIIEIEL